MPMHFLGGFWLSLAMYYFFFRHDMAKVIWKVILLTLLIGIGWEVFEIVFNNLIAGVSFNIIDTVSDIFFDLGGATFATLFILKQAVPVVETNV
jgi:hypothetical protein